MEWKRIVRYMYEYENGQKVRTTGFVRFDVGGKVCRAYIHGKRICAQNACDVYAFYESGDAIVRILLGYARVQNGALDGYVEMDPAHIGQTDVPFAQIAGLMLCADGGATYAAFLKREHPIGAVRDTETETTPEEAAAQPAEKTQEPAGEAERREANETTDGADRRETEEDREAERPVKAAFAAAERTGGELPPEETKSPCGVPETAGRETEPPCDAAETEVREAEPPCDAAEKEIGEAEASCDAAETVVEETEKTVTEELRCRRIGPRDLARLRCPDRRLANNSFLLHGYYNYRHLLLIEGEHERTLGVPGVYMERERRAASMFGFPNFMEAKECGVPTPMEARGQKAVFGYWCRRLPDR